MGFLRTYLALSVFFWEMAAETGSDHFLFNGAMSVISFFMISGFLMALTFSRNYQEGANGTARFFRNRFLRIYPPYLTIIGLTILVHSLTRQPNPFLGFGDLAPDISLPVQLVTAAVNLTIFGMDVQTFLLRVFNLSIPNGRLFGPGWSIACELMFYLSVPFLCRRSNRMLIGVAVLALVARGALAHDNLAYGIDPWRYYLALPNWIFFVMGMISFRLATPVLSLLRTRRLRWFALLSLATFMAAAGIDRFENLDSPLAWGYYVCLFLTLPIVWSESNDAALDDAIGQFSYPIYLAHPLVIATYKFVVPNAPSVLVSYAVIASSMLVLAALLRFVVERPIESLRSRIRQRQALASAAWSTSNRPTVSN